MTTFRASPDEPSQVVRPADQTSLLDKLKQTSKEYVDKERKRLENEASSLKAILNGRTGGKGIQQVSTTMVAAVALKDIQSYLAGS